MSGENVDYSTVPGISPPEQSHSMAIDPNRTQSGDYEPIHLDKASGDHSAAENQAAVTRAEWTDYKRRFAPVENTLINEIQDPSSYTQATQQAQNQVAGAFADQRDQFQRNQARYGGLDADAQADYDRQNSLDQAAAASEAANRARQSVYTRNMRTLGGGLAPRDPTTRQRS